MSSLRDFAIRNQVYLERLKAGQAREFNKVLRVFEQSISQAMASLGGVDISKTDRRQLNQILRTMREGQRAALSRQLDELERAMEELSVYEAEFERRSISTALRDVGLLNVSVRPGAAQAAFREAMDRPMSATGQLVRPWLDEMSMREIGQLESTFRRAHTDGWTNSQLMQAVRGTKANGYRDGILSALGRNHEAMVHTVMQHTASTARMATWEQNADIVSGYRWVSTLDSRTTPQCRSLDGREFTQGDGPRPPIHVRCRSTTVAVLDKRFEGLSAGRTRASAEGYTDASQTYYDWLKRQPAGFQDTVLGPTRAKLFRDGGLSSERFAQLSLGRTFEPLTLEEMKRLEPAAFLRAGIED